MMKQRNGIVVMGRLIGLVKPLSGTMALAIGMGWLGHLAASFITIFGGLALLRVLKNGANTNLFGLFAVLAVFSVARAALRYGEQSCNHFIAFKLLALIRDNVFKALRRLAPAKLDGRDKGDLIAVITSDIELLEVFYAHTISPIMLWVLFTTFMTLYIGARHAALGFLALAAYLSVGVLIPLIAAYRSGNDGIKFRTKSGELSAFILDNLRGLSETIQYGQGKHRLDEMNQRSEALSADEAHMKRVSGFNVAMTQSIILIFDIGMLFASAILFMAGTIEFESVLISTLALFSSFGPSVALANLGSGLQNTLAAGNRVLDILDETPVVEDIIGQPNISFAGASVKDVSFAYENEEILKNVSLTVQKNTILGITGRSGSGKSTLLKLFMRFWKTTSGAIEISETNVDAINTDNLREIESFVTQETHLFHDSIRNNLRIAKLDASDEEIENACRKASIHDFIAALPKGYDTQIGELGDSLSGGERQRLGLARAFLHDAPFLLLDEPTSNLDSLNEGVILKSLVDSREGKTVILVSHRSSTMRIADEIISVENGRAS